MPYKPKWDTDIEDYERIPDNDFEQDEVEGSLIQCGESGVLTASLRGHVVYAFSEDDDSGHWLVLLYDSPKRGIRVNLETGLILETEFYAKEN